VTLIAAVTARVPAKLNLQLAVGPARADGYHDVVTVYHAVSLFDEVTVAPADHDSVTVTGEGAGSVPADSSNLAVRAARALARALGPGCQDSPGLAIRISKRIPVAAGLAGGSADAAATLVACNELWQAGLSQSQLSEIAAGVGSDVAFALLGGTAIGLGRGEQVTPVLAAGTYHWVLAFATGELSTAQVYAAYDRMRAARSAAGGGPPAPAAPGAAPKGWRAVASGPGERGAGDREAGLGVGPGGRDVVDHEAGPGVGPGGRGVGDRAAGPRIGPGVPALDNRLMAALRAGDPAGVGPLLSNDLQAAAVSLHPALRRTLAAGREHGALGAIVSGSGPTCAYLARDARHARDLAVALAGAGVCRTVAHVQGPAPGATVISIATDQG
jgi:4-diphosphocytidyl-2-C-methyl-D-erythritol kinase